MILLDMGHNNLLSQLTNVVIFLMRTACNF